MHHADLRRAVSASLKGRLDHVYNHHEATGGRAVKRTYPQLSSSEQFDNPAFLESYEYVLAHSLTQRTYDDFHQDSYSRWLDHHAIGVDGPLLHRDVNDFPLIHLYLLSYERHALLNHLIIVIPIDHELS